MKITLDFSTCTEEALIALAKGCKDRDVLHKLFDVRNTEVKRAVLENEALTAEERGQLYSKDKYRHRLVSAFLEAELTAETLHQIVLDCIKNKTNIANYYEILYHDNVSIGTLNIICDLVMAESEKCNCELVEKCLELMAWHENADKYLLERLINKKPSLSNIVAQRSDYRLEVVSNVEVEE